MPSFENHIKWRFRGATNPAESPRLDHFGEFLLSGLGAQCHPDLLRQRRRYAGHCRNRIGDASARTEIFLRRVARERLHQHPGSVRLERALNVSCSSHRIAEIVQQIKARHQVEIPSGKVLSCGHLESDVADAATRARTLRGMLDRWLVEIVTNEG